LREKKAELDLELAEDALHVLKTYTHKRQLRQLESDVIQARMALERTQRRARASIVQAEADLNAKESELEQQRNILGKLEDQIAKARITAPIDGQVVYATSMRRRGNTEPLEEGREVREREELIYLPTTSSYMAEVKVHESNLEKIKAGLPVRITVDAVPGRTFYGQVARIAPLPDPQSVFLNPDLKVYNTDIHIDGDGGQLRSGMSCRAEILVDHYDEAIYVPVQAVVRVNGQPTVFVPEDGEFVPRPVELGLNNNRLARIVSGLEAGQLVSLVPPLAAAETGSVPEAISTALGDRIRQARSGAAQPEGGAGEAPLEATEELEPELAEALERGRSEDTRLIEEEEDGLVPTSQTDDSDNLVQ
jgi:HlyD family secretion protein